MSTKTSIKRVALVSASAWDLSTVPIIAAQIAKLEETATNFVKSISLAS